MISIIVAIAENYAIGKQGDLLCHLPADLKHFKEITSGKTVVMGIRPEDLDDSEAAVAQDNAVFTSTINVYELLGAEVFLDFEIGGTAVTARVDAATKARPGMEIKIAMDTNKIHVFDKETEQTITN